MYTNKLSFVTFAYIEENNNFKFFSVHFLLSNGITSRIWSHSNTYFGQHVLVLLNKFNNYEMPTINRKQIRPKQVEYKHDDKSAEYYNSSAWHSLRLDYYSKNPLCECCMAHDVVKSAEHVHHKRKFLSGVTDDERWSLLLEPSNLMSVCGKCHSALHTKAKRYAMNYVDELTDKEYADAHCIAGLSKF